MSDFLRTAEAIRSDATALAAATAETPDWSTVRSRLEALEIETIYETPYSLSAIGDRVGELLGSINEGLRVRALFAATLQAAIEAKVAGYAELIGAQQALSGDGLELWQSDRQSLIAALCASWSAADRNAVLGCGRRMISLAEKHTIADTTEAAIAADWAQASLQDLWIARRSVIDERIASGNITTVAGAVAVLEA